MERKQSLFKTKPILLQSMKLQSSSSDFHQYIKSKNQIDNRPFSQQGLKSFQDLHYNGSGPEQKRYYITKISAQMMKIRDEIHKILRTISNNKIYAGCLANTRVIAKQKAQVYANYEKELNVLNIALEINLNGMSKNEILRDISDMKAKNAALSMELDDLSTRTLRAANLENKMKEQLQQYTQSFSREERQEYDNLQEENKKYLDTINKHQKKISIFKQDTARFKDDIENNFLKLQRCKLLSKLHQLYEEKTEAQTTHEIFSIDSIKNVKQDVKALAKVKASLDQNLKLKVEEYKDISNLIKSNSDSLKNYCKCDKQAKDYSEKFDRTVRGLVAEIKNKEADIAKALDYLSGDALESQQPDVEVNCLNPLVQYKTLIARISKLATSKEKYDNEICCLRRELSEAKRRSEAFLDANAEDGKLKEQIRFLEERQNNLKASLADASSAVKDAKEYLERVEEVLCDNELYNELRPLILETEKLENENGELKNAIDTMLESYEKDSTDKLREIDCLVKKNNEKLILKLKQKHTK